MLAALVAASSAIALHVGFGETALTPPEPLPLGGYTERGSAKFEPGGDRLICRAISLQQGRQRVVLAIAELLTIPGSLAAAVRKRLPADIKLVLAATHTHCAPDSQMLNDRMTFAVPGIAPFNRRWLDWYAARIAAACLIALEAPGRAYMSVGYRSTVVRGTARGRRPAAQPEERVRSLDGLDNGRQVPLLGSFAAHPTLYDQTERKLRGDWIGRMLRVQAWAFFNGAAGDISPVSRTAGPNRPELESKLLAAALTQALAKVRRSTRMRPVLYFAQAPIRLDKPTPHPTFAARNGVPQPLARLLVDKFAEPAASVSVVRVGSIALLAVPGEPTAEVGRALEARARRAGFMDAIVIGLANGWIGYVLSAQDYARGGYEATLSFNGPKTAERLVEAAGAVLEKAARGAPNLRPRAGKSVRR